MKVRNKSAHLTVGVDMTGVKHVLGIWVQSTEGAKFWAGVCAEFGQPVRKIIYTVNPIEFVELSTTTDRQEPRALPQR